MTGSDVVVSVLRGGGGTASRRAVLDTLAADLGRRDAGAALAHAERAGDVHRVVLPNGRVGLRTADPSGAGNGPRESQDPEAGSAHRHAYVMATVPTTTATTIRERREMLRLSRPALAGLAGCSPTHLQNLEAGAIPRSGEVLGRVLDVLAACEADALASRPAETQAPENHESPGHHPEALAKQRGGDPRHAPS